MRNMDLGTLPIGLHPTFGEPLKDDEDGATYSLAIHEAAIALEAYCFYPDSEEDRKGFLSTFGALAYGRFEAREFPIFEGYESESKAHWQRELAATKRRWFEVHGGVQTLAASGGMGAIRAHIERSHDAVFWAGRIGTLIFNLDGAHRSAIRGGASLNKAIGLIAKTGGPKEDTLKAAWRDYSSVVHVLAALDYWFFVEGLAENFDEPGNLFAPAYYMTAATMYVARFYQEFFTSFVPKHGRKLPLVDPSKIWRLPEEVGYHPNLIRALPIREDDLAVVQNYRAPVPSQ